MGQLKHDADDAASYEPCNCVKQSDLPKRMSNERHHERSGDESQFPPNEAYQLPTLGSAKLTAANATLDDTYEVVNKMPLGPQKSVNQPKIVLLNSIYGSATLSWRQPSKETQIDVIVPTRQ